MTVIIDFAATLVCNQCGHRRKYAKNTQTWPRSFAFGNMQAKGDEDVYRRDGWRIHLVEIDGFTYGHLYCKRCARMRVLQGGKQLEAQP
jgi:hypothetical protein